MALPPIPSLSELSSRVRADISRNLTEEEAKDPLLRVLGAAQAAVVYGAWKFVHWVRRQAVPATMDDLEYWQFSERVGVSRLEARKAEILLSVTVNTDTVSTGGPFSFAADKEVYLESGPYIGGQLTAGGVSYTITGVEDADTITYEGSPAWTFRVRAEADEVGYVGPIPSSTFSDVYAIEWPAVMIADFDVLGFEAEDPDASDYGLSSAVGIYQGLDRESRAQNYRRLQQRMAFPPGAGSEQDYRRWAFRVPGISRIDIQFNVPSTNYVTYGLCSRDTDSGEPYSRAALEVQAALERYAPGTQSPVPTGYAYEGLTVTFNGQAQSEETLASAGEYVRDMLDEKGVPGEQISEEDVIRALVLGGMQGFYDVQLSFSGGYTAAVDAGTFIYLESLSHV